MKKFISLLLAVLMTVGTMVMPSAKSFVIAYRNLTKKDCKNYKESSIKEAKEKINKLKEYYLNMPFGYYRI